MMFIKVQHHIQVTRQSQIIAYCPVVQIPAHAASFCLLDTAFYLPQCCTAVLIIIMSGVPQGRLLRPALFNMAWTAGTRVSVASLPTTLSCVGQSAHWGEEMSFSGT